MAIGTKLYPVIVLKELENDSSISVISGFTYIYTKTNNNLYFKNTGITEARFYTSNESIIPNINSTNDIGTTNYSFRDLYLNGSIKIPNGQTIFNVNTTYNNTSVGHLAGGTNTGTNNVTVGYSSGYNLLNSANNTLIGTDAGYNLTTGDGNIFLGYQAGYQETGNDKLYISNWSGNTGQTLIYGDFSTNELTINADVEISNTIDIGGDLIKFSGFDFIRSANISTTVIGIEAATGLTSSGYNNVIIGYRAMQSIESWDNCTAIGVEAGRYQRYHHQIFIGYQAGLGVEGVTTADGSMAIGNYALKVIETGSNNLAIGHSTMFKFTDGSSNTAVGYNAIFNNLTGSYNTGLGQGALYQSLGSSNVAIGYYAGQNAQSGGVYIGHKAGFYETGSNKLFIANDNHTSEAISRITSLVYGEFDTPLLRFNSTVEISGNTIPIYNNSTDLGSSSYGWRNLYLSNDSGIYVGSIEGIRVGSGETWLNHEIHIENDTWITGRNNSGTTEVNIIKINTNDEIELGATFNVGSLEAAEDSGAVTLFDMPVSSTPTLGDEMSATIKIDGNNILKIYAEADGTGGVDTYRVKLLNKAKLVLQDSTGIEHTYEADSDGSLIIS